MASTLPVAKHVPILNYDALVSALNKELIKTIYEDNYAPISGITMDSRDIFFNEMFLAIDGKNFRGIDFINTAYARGVRVFTLAEKYLPNLKDLPQEVNQQSCFLLVNDPVAAYQVLASYYLTKMGGVRIAITGSAGKTTTKEMLAKTLGSEYQVFYSHKNENNHFGVPKNIFFLQRRLIGGEAISIMIFEMGMNHAGEIHTLSSIVKPHLAVITNILYAHIGNFTQREDIALAKGEVIPHLTSHPNLSDYPGGLLVIPEKIFNKKALLNQVSQVISPPSVKEVKTSVTTTSYLKHGEENIDRGIISQWTDTVTGTKIEVPGLSTFMNETLSLVLTIGEIFGIPRQQSFSHLLNLKKISDKNKTSSFPPVLNSPQAKSRLHIINQTNTPLIIDDTYNANPDSVIQVVSSLISLISLSPAKFHLQVILGDMLELGNFSKSLHETCGEKINQALSDLTPENQQRIKFFLLGPEMKACYDSMKFPFKKYYEKYSPKDTIIKDLIKTCDSSSLVFFKASHGMRFDRLLNDFLENFMNLSHSSASTS